MYVFDGPSKTSMENRTYYVNPTIGSVRLVTDHDYKDSKSIQQSRNIGE